LEVTLPADGEYRLRLGDTQQAGGGAYGYRLRIGPPRPDFELRVVPSTVNARAGATVPLTVYALRKDGFCEDITLELKDPPGGFTLSGGWVPAGQDQVRLTLTVPSAPAQERVRLGLEGRAMIDGREVRRPAVPAEDMTQAFVYRHVVPADDLMVAITGRRWARGSPKLLVDGPDPAARSSHMRRTSGRPRVWKTPRTTRTPPTTPRTSPTTTRTPPTTPRRRRARLRLAAKREGWTSARWRQLLLPSPLAGEGSGVRGFEG
jgi:hypothetical protein